MIEEDINIWMDAFGEDFVSVVFYIVVGVVMYVAKCTKDGC